MKRKLRDSTLAKSDELKQKLRNRDRDSVRKRSEKLIRIAERNKAKLDAAIELSVVNKSNNTDTSPNKETEEELDCQESEDYWFDTSNIELIGLTESPITPASASAQDPDSWSSNNRFFPEDCIISPISSIQRAASLPTLALRPTETNLGGSLEPVQSDSSSISTILPPSPTGTVIVAMDDFKVKLKDIKKLKEELYLLVDCYNEETVTILDKDYYRDELQTISNSLINLQNKASDLKLSLDEDIAEQKSMYNEVTALMDEAKMRVSQNSIAVKKQIANLIKEEVSTSLGHSAETEQKKLTLKIKNATDRFTLLKNEVEKLPDVNEMSDNDIRQSLLDSKDWKKDMKSYQSLKETLDVDLVTVTIEEETSEVYNTAYVDMVKVVSEKMSELLLADKNLGLFSLADNKTKNVVQYPDSFGGTMGENVFKFIKEFRDAISADQVRKADEVKTLLKHLKGDAKTTIGEHHKSLDAALKQLEDNYGCPRLIMEKYTRDYDKALGNIRNWGKHGSKERVDAINRTADFIRNLENLASDHPAHLKSEIYCKQTLLLLTKGMPHEYTKKLNETCGHADPYEDWIAAVFDILNEVKSTNLSALSTGIGAAKLSKDDHGPPSKANSLTHNGHDCNKSNNCKERWDYLGCINLYKMTQLADRETFLRERKACFKCGRSPFSIKGGKRHLCSWRNGKMAARCTGKHSSGGRCFKAAAMCMEHEENASDVLLDWLQSHKIKFSVNMILLSQSSQPSGTFYEDLKSKVSKQDGLVAKARLMVKSRESLQSGKSAMMMNDNEIQEFFQNDMKQLKSTAEVHEIPHGDPVFMFCVVQGLCNPVMTFLDSGCNCWLAEEGIPESEFISVKLSDGPIPLSVASGITTYASAEYASLLPLANGNFQAVRGLTLPTVTGDMPLLNLVPTFDQIKRECKSNKRLQNIKVPKIVGGHIQMILGIKYQSIYPTVLHTFPNGLTVFESKLMPAESGALACIGGPVSTLESLCGNIGVSSTMTYMANLTQSLGSYMKVDLFPNNYLSCLPEEINYPDATCSDCGVFLVQSDLERFMKLQDAGLDPNFKCPSCRDCKSCLKGAGKELLTMKEEFQQQLIQKSVRIDEDNGHAVARLAFMTDPSESITNNEHIAVKRLLDVCKKYGSDPSVSSMISKGFKKLVDKGYIVLYSDLNEEEKTLVDSEPSYHIPWDVNFKPDSVTTPARATFDASSKTPGGGSLNDNLAKGRTDLVNLFSMVISWLIGPVAIHGDISKFYNCVLLDKRDWKYQKVVWFDNLDPSGVLMKGIVKTLIYGVRCVSAQTELVKDLLQEKVRNNPTSPKSIEVADFLHKGFYVDDGGTSVKTMEDAYALTKETDAVLSTVNMFVKGWSISFNTPSPEVSDDGISVGFAGMLWFPAVDSFSLKIQPLHFGKKRRGRYPTDLVRYTGGSLDEFVPANLSRRMCSSVAARIYDVPGLLAPLTLKLKFDLRKIILVDPSWDTALSSELRLVWLEDFRFIEEMRDVMYVRCKVPTDALRCSLRLWLLCDGSPDGGMVVTAYSGFEKSNGSWSCQLLCAKNLLTPQGWTTPQTELHALSSLANLASVLQSSLSSWIEVLRSGSDSSIALSWAIYEKARLHVFHRLRVSNIRNKLDFTNLYHVVGKENIADTGTRPELLKPEHLLPGSSWLCGLDWMREPLETAIESGAIKSVKNIKLDNEAKKILKEGIMLDSTLNTVSTELKHSISNKVIEREKFSNYVYPPLKWRFPKFIRIVGFILRAARKFKLGMVAARQRRGLLVSDGSTVESLGEQLPKFKMFSVSSNAQPNTMCNTLSRTFSINGISVQTSIGMKKIHLSDYDLSCSLEYIYKKAGAEVCHFNDRKLVQRTGVISDDGIVYCKSRIEEGQALRVVGGLNEFIDLESFTGISFNVPIIDRYSPIAISLAYYIHYDVIKHRGYETTYRMSLQFAKILGGRSLMKHIREECTYCQKLLLKYVKQVIGPLSDQQLTISPVFYYSFADAWGPLRAYVPSHQRSTRSGDKTYDVYMLIFGCAATSTINCQIMEGGKSTGDVLQALNRFFVEACVPKIMFIDKDSALIKALSEGQLEILSNDGVISQERGIQFQTCSAQGHNMHGRIERRIKMVQEAFDRCEMRKFKLSGLAWQSVAKRVEYDVNSVPLGYLSHREDNVPLLRVLTPNFLKINAGSSRAPNSLFTLPTRVEGLMGHVENVYRVFYKIWNDSYVPLIAKQQRWFEGDVDLQENDIIYFKLRDSAMDSTWLIGKVEEVMRSKDGKVRRVLVGYKFNTEQGTREFRVVERPVRECVRLMNLEDTTLLEDLKRVRDEAKVILDRDLPLVRDNGVQDSSQGCMVTYACNSFIGSEYACTSVDIGTLASSFVLDSVHDCTTDGIGQAEAKLGFQHDEIFDLNDTYDKFDDNSLILL